MKIFLLRSFCMLLLLGIAVQAQAYGPSYGVRGGVNFQNINGKDFSGDKLDLNVVPRFHAGAFVDIPIARDFFVQPGLFFATKGAKSENDLLGLNSSIEYNVSYLELPVSLLYKSRLGKGFLLLGFGPYVGYGIGGKSKYTVNSASFEEKIKFEQEYEGMEGLYTFKPLDFGANLFFGYQLFSGLSFQLNTQLGLAEVFPENKVVSNDETSFKHTGFGLSIGYSF